MDDKKLKKLKKLSDLEEAPDLALQESIEELEEKIEESSSKMTNDIKEAIYDAANNIVIPEQKETNLTPVLDRLNSLEEELKKKSTFSLSPELKKELKGEKGDTTIVEKVIEKTTEIVKEIPIVTENVVEKITEEISGDKIVDRINTQDKLIKKEKIEGLDSLERLVKQQGIYSTKSHIWQGVSEVRVNELISNDKRLHPSTDTDEKVAYKSGSTPGYLKDVTVAGTGITLEEGTGGDAGKLKITNSLDLSGYVPYTGATADLNLGTHSITASNFTGSSSGSNTGDQDLSNLVEEAPSDDKQYARKNAGWVEVEASSSADGIGFDIDGFGIVPSTTVIGSYVAKKSGTITGWKIIESNGVSSSIVLTVKKNGTAISGTEKPTLSNASSAEDTELTTWTTSIAKGDIISISIDSVSVGTKFFLQIYYN